MDEFAKPFTGPKLRVNEVCIGCLNVGARAVFLPALTPPVSTVALWYCRPLLPYRTWHFLSICPTPLGQILRMQSRMNARKAVQGGGGGGNGPSLGSETGSDTYTMFRCERCLTF